MNEVRNLGSLCEVKLSLRQPVKLKISGSKPAGVKELVLPSSVAADDSFRSDLDFKLQLLLLLGPREGYIEKVGSLKSRLRQLGFDPGYPWQSFTISLKL